MSDDRPWREALAYSLTGERLPGAGGLPSVEEWWRWAGDAGWTPARVRARAATAAATGERWPFPLPRELSAAIGSPAQFYALLRMVCEGLPGTNGTVAAAPPATGGGVSAEERRLRDEVPPHFGHFG